jgi:hypothetical protein
MSQQHLVKQQAKATRQPTSSTSSIVDKNVSRMLGTVNVSSLRLDDGDHSQRASLMRLGKGRVQRFVVTAVDGAGGPPLDVEPERLGQPWVAEELSITTVVSCSNDSRPANAIASWLAPSSSSASPTSTTVSLRPEAESGGYGEGQAVSERSAGDLDARDPRIVRVRAEA